MLNVMDLWQVPVLVVLVALSVFISVWLTVSEEESL
jgi:hypothetical protein